MYSYTRILAGEPGVARGKSNFCTKIFFLQTHFSLQTYCSLQKYFSLQTCDGDSTGDVIVFNPPPVTSPNRHR